MNYYRMLNAGLEPSGDLNFFGVIKWMLGLLIIFILIQNYWELVSGKVYIFSYHRYKSKNRWLGTHTMKVLGICLLYSGIMAGINSFIDSFSVEEIIKQWLLYGAYEC